MRFILFMLGCAWMMSCSKQVEALPLKQGQQISFRMANTPFFLEKADKAITYEACGLYQYEITFSKESIKYFKITLSSDGPLKEGDYIMKGQPTISIAGRSTFYYSGPGESYTASTLTVHVISFTNSRLVATFSGDKIQNGLISNVLMVDNR